MRCSLADALRALPALVLAAALATSALAVDLDSAMRESQAAIGRTVDDFAFTTAEGRRLRMSDFRGKPLVVSFVYTGCSQICPATTRFLAIAVKEANRALGPGAYNVATIGFNLPFDNPAAMRQFARQQGIDDPQWTFLSPDAGSVEALTRAFGFVYAPSPGGFDHIAQVTIVDANGRVARQIYGDTFDPQLLVGAVREVTTGAPGALQDLSGLLDRVRVLCSVYDPATGKYRLDYSLFIEIFAGLTVLGTIAYYLGGEWRRQRRARRERVAA